MSGAPAVIRGPRGLVRGVVVHRSRPSVSASSKTCPASGSLAVFRYPMPATQNHSDIRERSWREPAIARPTPLIVFDCEIVKALITTIASAASRSSSHNGAAAVKHRICEDARNDPETSNFHLRLAQNP